MLGYVASSMAQTTSEHLTFKGIPIDGPLNAFVAKMKAAGFKHLGTEDGRATFEGRFAGFSDCFIGAETQNNKVYMIAAIVAMKNDWPSLETAYQTLKNMLISKYGEPSTCIERFDSNVSDQDVLKLLALAMGNCTYETIFITSKGQIRLSMTSADFACSVGITYLDKINGDASFSSRVDDL